MIDKIIRFSLHNRLLVLVAAVALMIAGLWSAQNTEVDVFPDLNAPTVAVMTEAPGMAAEEVEQMVTFPIETSLNGAKDVRRVRSSSTAGFSVVWVEFDWDADPYIARQTVAERLTEAAAKLPDGVDTPVMGPQSSILGEMFIVGLTSETDKNGNPAVSPTDMRTIADRTIAPALLSVPGVAQVSVLGGDVKEYQILLHPAKMSNYGVTFSDVLEATEAMNENANGGVLNEYGNEYIVRGILATADLSQMRALCVKPSDTPGQPGVTLRDIADIKVGSALPKLGAASVRGQNAVLLTVSKQPATGTNQLTEALEKKLATVSHSLPAGIKVSTDIFRQSDFIDASIGNVKSSLYEGAIFVIIVLFLFLANVRATLISVVSLPLSVVIAMLCLKWCGLTINTMSLGGLAIAIGSLVDDAVVDVENVWKRVRANRRLPEGERRNIRDVVFEASREVRMPILNSTLIIIVSFVPLFFLTGMEGRMLIPLGVAFIVALIASTIVALTLTPVLCSYMLGGKSGDTVPKEPRISIWLKEKYGKLLSGALRHGKWVFFSTVGLFIISLVIFFSLGSSFLPPFNEGSFTINVSTLPGVSLAESDAIGHRAEQLLLEIPEIHTIARKTGRAELDEHALGTNVSEIEAPFVLDNGRSAAEVKKEVREKLSHIHGANIEIGQPISHRIDAMLSGSKANIAIKIFGDNLSILRQTAGEVREAIESVPGAADINVELQVERPELKIEPKREIMSLYGITASDFRKIVATALGGESVSRVYEDGRSVDVTVRLDPRLHDNMESISRMEISTPSGKIVTLGEIAYIKSVTGPATIGRENVKRKIVVSANAEGRDLGSVVADMEKAVSEKVALPEGYSVEFGGQFENQRSASSRLLWTSICAIVVIFLLLYMQFKNLTQSAVILLNLPFALIGGVFALWITGGDVSIPAIIGFISLFGIATRNGMLLMSNYNMLSERKGLSLNEVIVEGSTDRLNPILMTALTSALALIPLAFKSVEPGNEIQSPMAKVILGGLISSTLLNSFVIPIVYKWMRTRKTKSIRS